MKLRASLDPFASFHRASPSDVSSEGSRLRDTVGVYAIFLKEADAFLLESGICAQDLITAPELEGGRHVYTGETWGLKSRLRHHFSGNVIASNMRMTLMALQAGGTRVFCDELPDSYVEAEGRLSAWLLARASITYRECGLTREVERDILACTLSPLNIAGRDSCPFAQRLKAERRAFGRHPFMKEARALAERPKRYRR